MQTKSAKIPGLLFLLLSHFNGFGQSDAQLERIGNAIVRAAQRDVGYQELTWRNDSPAYDFYRFVGGGSNKKSVKGWQEPTCGYAVYTWHRLAGVRPQLLTPGRAYSWYNHPSRVMLGKFTTVAQTQRLKPGMVIGFKFTGYHVGIIEKVFSLYVQTIEANTSTQGAIGNYQSNHEGVIRKMRFYKSATWACDWRGSVRADSLPVAALHRKFLGK